MNRLLLLTGLLAVTMAPSPAATAPSAASLREGERLAEELRNLAPEEGFDVNGTLMRRDGEGRRTRVPLRFSVVVGDGLWKSIYEVSGAGGSAVERLEVVHRTGQPTEYIHQAATIGGQGEKRVLRGEQAMVPFAGSDFWAADLGMEFLYWPSQRVVEEANIRMRKGRPCRVLESVNPNPTGDGGYVRVRAWIDRETGKPILAEAYGVDGRRMKVFEIGSVTKVNGRWELKNMEMRSERLDTLTVFEFKFERVEP